MIRRPRILLIHTSIPTIRTPFNRLPLIRRRRHLPITIPRILISRRLPSYSTTTPRPTSTLHQTIPPLKLLHLYIRKWSIRLRRWTPPSNQVRVWWSVINHYSLLSSSSCRSPSSATYDLLQRPSGHPRSSVWEEPVSRYSIAWTALRTARCSRGTHSSKSTVFDKSWCLTVFSS